MSYPSTITWFQNKLCRWGACQPDLQYFIIFYSFFCSILLHMLMNPPVWCVNLDLYTCTVVILYNIQFSSVKSADIYSIIVVSSNKTLDQQACPQSTL